MHLSSYFEIGYWKLEIGYTNIQFHFFVYPISNIQFQKVKYKFAYNKKLNIIKQGGTVTQHEDNFENPETLI